MNKLVKTVTATARFSARSSVDSMMSLIEAGKPLPAEKANPFFIPGGKAPKALAHYPDRELANAIIERGLHKDKAFMSAMRGGLGLVAMNAIGGVLSAADGEGHVEGETPFNIVSADGKRADGGFLDHLGSMDDE